MKQNMEKKKRSTLNRRVGLRILKKYRCLSSLSKQMEKDWLNCTLKNVCRTFRQNYGQTVVDFTEREDNSTTLPRKRDTKRTEDGTKQNRTLNNYLHNMYDKFRIENPSIEISKTSFLRIQPKHILYSCFSSRKT
ncbi:hypothetical protein MAR_032495, partial [Mya arenaria]